MNGSEKQIEFSKAIISEFNESVTAAKNKQKLRIEKMVARGKDPKDFIGRNEEANYWTNMIVSIISEGSVPPLVSHSIILLAPAFFAVLMHFIA